MYIFHFGFASKAKHKIYIEILHIKYFFKNDIIFTKLIFFLRAGIKNLFEYTYKIFF